MNSKDAMSLALGNISKYGDTDIFPFSIEKKTFFDLKDSYIKELERVDSGFKEIIEKTKIPIVNALSPVGYTGFRWASKIDAVWDAYLLSLVLSISDKIEQSRIPTGEKKVFSYRIKVDEVESTLFDNNYNWRSFQDHSLKMCDKKEYNYVLIADISNFYSRVYHHRVDNALRKLNVNPDITYKITEILKNFSDSKSYGLPIGGNASRILSELVLDRTDKLLKVSGVNFIRYADDYHIFAETEQKAFSDLTKLSTKLLDIEGLSLQKSKTRIMSTEEFKLNSELHRENVSPDRKTEFLRVNLRYDPYSDDPKGEYEELKSQVKKFDILGILKDEINSKSKIHKHLVSRLVKSIQYLDDKAKLDAVITLLNSLPTLAPVFSQVMITIRKVISEFDQTTKAEICDLLIKEYTDDNYLFQIKMNLHYVVLVLGEYKRDENEIILNTIFETTDNLLIRKDIILIMIKWSNSDWVSQLKSQFSTLSSWEQSSFIIGSYILADEGKHWRAHRKGSFSDSDKLIREWASIKAQNGKLGDLI